MWPVTASNTRSDQAADHRSGRSAVEAGWDRRLGSIGAHGGRRPDQRCLLRPLRSKDELVATAVADQLRQQLERYRAQASDREGVELLVCDYLSIEHRDDPEHGCPSAALLDEIGRCSDATKRAYTDGVLGLVDQIASILDPGDPESARGQTLSLFALLIGTLQLSRALADRGLADLVLERGIENALALFSDA